MDHLGDLLSGLLLGDDHLMQRILKHFPTLLDGFPFGDHLRPFDLLRYVAGGDFRLFGSMCLERKTIPHLMEMITPARAGQQRTGAARELS